MTEVAERPKPVPLTDPVPGAWIQLPDRRIPPVYVPYEPIFKHNADGRDEVVGHAPGTHIKRLLQDGAMYTNGPTGMVPTPAPELASTEAALRARLDQAEAEREQFMKELQELRAKMEADQALPNVGKKR
jgi:hypothetical protein